MQKEFLLQFPEARRSEVAAVFHEAVRKGAMDPAAVVAAVRVALFRRGAGAALERGGTRLREEQGFRSAVISALNRDPDAAKAYAAQVLARGAPPTPDDVPLRGVRLKYLKAAEAERCGWRSPERDRWLESVYGDPWIMAMSDLVHRVLLGTEGRP